MQDPTALEQMQLELINRARQDPQGEFDLLIADANGQTGINANITNALRFFGVDLALFAQQLSGLAAVAPLAWNGSLALAAHRHSQLLIENDTQSHQVPGEAGLLDRIRAAGYDALTHVAENVYAYGRDSDHIHGGFYIDWGDTPTGIQQPAGHRDNILSPLMREIGIAVLPESAPQTNVGPYVVTQNFGNRTSYVPHLLGVVIDDGDGDGAYDIGEGLGGVTIRAVSQAGQAVVTTSWDSGGYQMALAPGQYTVTWSGGGLAAPVVQTVTMGCENLKRDALSPDPATLPQPEPEPVPDPVSEPDPDPVAGQLVTGTAGNDLLRGTAGDDGLQGQGGDDTIEGGGGADTISASDGDDHVLGGADDDLIGGGPGRDSIEGGGGDDFMGGGLDDDTMDGGDGDDVVNGGPGDDSLSGGAGNDTMAGSFGDDDVSGGYGRDNLGGGTGSDWLDGGAGDDRIGGGEGSDTILGGAGDDFLAGGGRHDLLDGGSGADTLNGGAGNDTLLGGAGADLFVFNAPGPGEVDLIRDFETGIDRIRLSGVAGSDAQDRFDTLGIVAGLPDGGAGVTLVYGAHLIGLAGLSPGDLDAGDFLFL